MTETAAGRPPYRRRRRAETRRAIVDAGFRLFSRDGYARTSVREIAAAVGVTNAALYKHFASKKDLLDAVIADRGGGRWTEWLEELRSTLPLRESLERVARGALIFTEQNRDLVRLIMFEALAGDAGAVAHHAGMMLRWRDGIRALILGSDPAMSESEVAEIAEALTTSVWGAAVGRILGSDLEPFADHDGEPTARCVGLSHRLVAHLLR